MNQPKIFSQNQLASNKSNSSQLNEGCSTEGSSVEHIENKDGLSEETKYSNWESQMAKLVGLEEESLQSDTKEIENLAKRQFITDQSDKEISKKQQLSTNPFAKLGLVGSATLVIALLAGTFLSQITNIGQAKPSQNKSVTAVELPKQSEEEFYVENLEGEVEVLKTKLALAKQAEAVKIAQQTLKQNPQKTLESSVSTKEALPKKVPTPLPPIIPPTNEPRIVYVERPVPQPIAPSPQEKSDPQQEWMRLAKLGSYGQVSATSEPVIASRVKNHATEPKLTQEARIQNPESTKQAKTSSDNLSERLTHKQNRKFVAVGSSAKAVLATAVFGEANSSSNVNQQEENFFVANLKEPLKTVDGEVALPVDTKLLLQVGSLSDRGLMRLKVVKIITDDNGIISEKSLPPNAIAINAPRGKPLLAEKFSNKSSSIAFKDAQLFLLGGLGRAAELQNRNDTEVVTINGSSTIVSNDRSQNDLLAGAVQGGIETLAPKLAQRNEQQISQMLQRSNVWLISAGTKIELYVNKDIQL